MDQDKRPKPAKTGDAPALPARRGFLKLTGAGLAAGGAGLVPAAAAHAGEAKSVASDKRGDYRESEHVRTYYKLAR